MRILYLTPSHVDYLADQIYTGLCNTLGWEMIIDFPYKKIYHDPESRVPFIPQNPGCEYQFEEIINLLNQKAIDLVVLSAIRKDPLLAIEKIREKCKLPPIVLLDGDDGIQVRSDLFFRYGVALYFKREFLCSNNSLCLWVQSKIQGLKYGHDISDRTYPLPFSAILEGIPNMGDEEKDVDISFVGIASNRNRLRAVRMLKEAEGIRFEGSVFGEPTTRKSKMAIGTFSVLKAKLQGDPYVSELDQSGKKGYGEYFHLLNRSKMALSIRGAGFDTLRYWEIVGSKNLLVSEKPYIFIPNNFEHGKHVLFCKPDLSDLLGIVRSYLKDEGACKQIAMEGYKHLLKFHTCDRRAQQLLEVCKKKI